MKKAIHNNYHWVVAFVALLAYTIYGGLLNNISSLYLVPVSETLQVSRTTISLTSSLRSIGSFTTNLMFGVIYKRFGFRKMATVGLIVIGLAFCGLASAQTVFSYAIFDLLIGLFDATCATASLSKLVNEWFESHRGLVLGVITASSGFGGSLFSILLTNVMEKNSWRAAHLLSGIMTIIGGLCVLALVRSKPSDMGLRPFGEGSGSDDSHKKKAHHPEHLGLPVQRLMKTPTFYLMLLSCVISAACGYAPLHILIAHLCDCGLTQADAAKIQSIMYLLMAIMKILDGYLSDIVGAKIVVIFSTVCCGAACWLFADVTNFQSALLPTVLIAMGLPLTSILQPLSTGAVLGMRSYDTMVGLMLSMVAIAGMSTSPIMNAFYGKLGSYCQPLRAVAFVSVFSIALYLLVCRMAARDQEKYEAEEKPKY